MVRYLFYTIGDLTYQSPLILSSLGIPSSFLLSAFQITILFVFLDSLMCQSLQPHLFI